MSDDSIDEDLKELRAEIAQFMLDAIVKDPNNSVPSAIAVALEKTLEPQLKARIDATLPELVRQAVEHGYRQGLQARNPQERTGPAAPVYTGAPPAPNAAPNTTGEPPSVAARPAAGDVQAERSARFEQNLGGVVEARPRRRGWFNGDPWSSRRRLGVTVAALATLGVAVVVAYLLFLQPRPDRTVTSDGSFRQQQTPDDRASVDVETGWDRILDQVQAWPEAERAPALRALCGHDVTDRANCPGYGARRFLIEPGDRARATAAITRAMSEAHLCGPAEDSLTDDTAANTAGAHGNQTGSSNSASSTSGTAAAAGRDSAPPLADCLVYGAARG